MYMGATESTRVSTTTINAGFPNGDTIDYRNRAAADLQRYFDENICYSTNANDHNHLAITVDYNGNASKTQPLRRRQYSTTIFLLNPPRELLLYQQQQKQQSINWEKREFGYDKLKDDVKSDGSNNIKNDVTKQFCIDNGTKNKPTLKDDSNDNKIQSKNTVKLAAENKSAPLATVSSISSLSQNYPETSDSSALASISMSASASASTTLSPISSASSTSSSSTSSLKENKQPENYCRLDTNNGEKSGEKIAVEMDKNPEILSITPFTQTQNFVIATQKYYNTAGFSDIQPRPQYCSQSSDSVADRNPQKCMSNSSNSEPKKGGEYYDGGSVDYGQSETARRQLIDALLKTFSRHHRRRRSIDTDTINAGGYDSALSANQNGNDRNEIQSRFRVPAILASPKLIVTSPFRGLRRAASSASSINCCSASPCASAANFLHTSAASHGSGFAIGHAYPYPRSHTTLMVLPSRVQQQQQTVSQSILNDSSYNSRDWTGIDSDYCSDKSFTVALDNLNNNAYGNLPTPISTNIVKTHNESRNTIIGNEEPHNLSLYNFATRPPLNRAIPPIPESKSNESIISAHANAHNVFLRTTNNAANFSGKTENNNEMPSGSSVSFAADVTTSKTKYPENVPIVSKFEHKAIAECDHNNNTNLTSFNQQKSPAATPKSPLMSMAHIMRSRFSKIGTRLSRDSSSSGIRASKSMTTMMKKDTSSGEFPAKAKKFAGKSTSKLPKSISVGGGADDKRGGKKGSTDRPSIELVQTVGWYSASESTVPRRLPSTTLILSTMGLKSLPTRLPPDDLPVAQMASTTQLQAAKTNETETKELQIAELKITQPHSILKSSIHNSNNNNAALKLTENIIKLSSDSTMGDENPVKTTMENNITISEIVEDIIENIIVADNLPSQNAKQVHFGRVESPVMLRKTEEMTFVQLDYRGHDVLPPVTINETIQNIDDESIQLDYSLSQVSAALPLRPGEKTSGRDLWQVPTKSIPPLPISMGSSGLRKTPSSFPPMPLSDDYESSRAISPPPAGTLRRRQHQPPRSLSIGARPRAPLGDILLGDSPLMARFAVADSNPIANLACNKKLHATVQKNESFPATRRSIFSTQSLRLAASRLAEASPRLRRRSRTPTRKIDEYETSPEAIITATEPTENYRNETQKRRRVFCKSESLPESKALKKEKCNRKKKKELNASSLGLSQMELEPEIRTIKTVQSYLRNLRAPLAEFESSRVAENSPAVELPLMDFGVRQATPAKFSEPWHSNGCDRIRPDLNNNNKHEIETNKIISETFTTSTVTIPGDSRNGDAPKLTDFFARLPPPLPIKSPPPIESPPPATIVIAPIENKPAQIALNDATSTDSNVNLPLTTVIEKETHKQQSTTTNKPSRIAKWNWGRSTKQQQKETIDKDKGTVTQKNYNKQEKMNGVTVMETKSSRNSYAERIISPLERLKLGHANGASTSNATPSSQPRKLASTNGTRNMTMITHSRKHLENGASHKDTSLKRVGDVKKSVDDVRLQDDDFDELTGLIVLPEILSDFKTQLVTLQDEIQNDYEEIERLRVENEELQKKLESRDAIIDALRAQLAAGRKL